jgi:Domain of unknown function (DUF4440)
MARRGRCTAIASIEAGWGELEGGPVLRSIFLLALCGGCFGASIAGSQGAIAADTPESVEQIKAEVLKVNAEVDRAVEKNDAEGLGSAVSDELEYTNQMGQVINKVEWQAHLRSGELKMITIRHQVDRMHFFGNTVVVVGTSRSTVLFNGKISHGPRKFTRVFVKQNGAWQLVAQHVSLVAKP